MTTPQISPLPPMPARTDAPVDFSAKADAALAALQPFASQANTLADFVNTRANNAASSAASVAGVQAAVSADRVLSQTAASNAAGSAAAAGVSATNAQDSAAAAGSFAVASKASAVRAETAAEYVEGISGGAAPINNPNFQGVVKVNDVPLGTAATKNVGGGYDDIVSARDFGLKSAIRSENLTKYNESGFFLATNGTIVPPDILSDGGWAINLNWHHSRGGSRYNAAIMGNIQNDVLKYQRMLNDGVLRSVHISHSGNLLTTTGQSTQFPMTQKATTDAIANIPSAPKTAAYTVTAADKGASIDTTTNVTIPASVFAVGDVIVVTNTSATNSSITAAAGVTLRLAGTTSTGTRTLAGYGVATLRMASNNVWFASGAGLS